MSRNFELNRRHLVAAVCLLPLSGVWAAPTPALMEVWKDPNCGCCKDWIALVEQAGFTVRVFDTGNNGARAKLGLPAKFGS